MGVPARRCPRLVDLEAALRRRRLLPRHRLRRAARAPHAGGADRARPDPAAPSGARHAGAAPHRARRRGAAPASAPGHRRLAGHAPTTSSPCCGVPAERIRVVPLGVEPALPPATGGRRARSRGARASASTDRYLLHVGTLEPRKNLPLLIAACARLLARRPTRRIAWCSPAHPAGARRRWPTPSRDRPRSAVVRLGRVAAADLPALYAAADGAGLPVALRGLRPAAARGDGVRHAGARRARRRAAGGRRRRRPAGRSARRRGRVGDAVRAHRSRTRTCAPACAPPARARAAHVHLGALRARDPRVTRRRCDLRRSYRQRRCRSVSPCALCRRHRASRSTA